MTLERAEGTLELLDRPVALADRVASLADIDRLNAWFGGYALTLREVRRVAASMDAGDALVAVDVGGGHGAFAVRLVEWARAARRLVRVLVVDRDAESLAVARRACADYPEIRLVLADAAALPVREGVADVVTSALTLHHLEPDGAVASLREMAAAARRAVIVNDLLRTRLAFGLVWLATRLLRCHPISRHDGPLSVRRAYSAAEVPPLVLKTVDGLATPLAGMRITAPDGTVVSGAYRAVGDWRPYREHAMAIERALLDEALVDRVRALPIDFREQVRVTDVFVERGRAVGVEAVDREGRAARLPATLVIAADGRASVVAQRLGLRRAHRLKRMALVTYVSDLDGCRDYGEIFVDPPDYAIINPVAADRANLSIVVPLAHGARWSGRLETFFTARVRQLPHLARRLAGARIVAPVNAMGPLAYEVGVPRVGGVLLVGDAAGFFDPFTGEGIYAALRGAELAVETAVGALRAGDCSRRALAAYGRARRRAFGGKARVTRALQFVISHRGLANLTARVLAQRPGLLDVLLGVIGDFVPPKALVTGRVR